MSDHANVQVEGEPCPKLDGTASDVLNSKQVTLQHFARRLPQRDDFKGQKTWDMKRWTYEYLYAKHQIVIPVFQRYYCWETNQIQDWYLDATGLRQNRCGHTPDHSHDTGKVILKADESSSNDGGVPKLICIDGQQRSTSLQILLASIRDMWTDNETLEQVEQYLFLDPKYVHQLAKEWACHVSSRVCKKMESYQTIIEDEWIAYFQPGKRAKFEPVLLPSYKDRAPFFRILTCRLFTAALVSELADIMDTNLVAKTMKECNDRLTKGSNQQLAKQCFDEKLATRTHDLESILKYCLNKVSFMCCMVVQDLNLAQLFLYLQEKSLFGMGRMLANATPGVDFKCEALIRNLLMANVVELPNSEEIYEKYWVQQLESGTRELNDELIHKFVKSVNTSHKSAFEIQMDGIREDMPVFKQKTRMMRDKGIMLYASFVSCVEAIEFEHSGQYESLSWKTAKQVMKQLSKLTL